jgi:hypothetical protein
MTTRLDVDADGHLAHDRLDDLRDDFDLADLDHMLLDDANHLLLRAMKRR